MLSAIIPAMVTPTENGSVSINRLILYTNWLIDHGVRGLFPVGTTGEGLLLTREDWKKVVQTVISVTAKRIPVIIQCGALSQEETTERIHYSVCHGCDAVALLTPFFYQYSQQALEAYYSEILSSWPETNFYLYNIPKYTGNDISPDLYQRLAKKHSNVKGIKDSIGSLNRLKELVQAAPSLTVLSGSDGAMKEAQLLGVKGIVSAVGCAFPAVISEAWNQLSTGDQSGDLKVKQIMDIFHKTSSIHAIRSVMRYRGFDVGESLSPLRFENHEEQLVIEPLEQLKILN